MKQSVNPRPYAVMVTPSGSTLSFEPFLARAALERAGCSFLADFPGYYPAAERAAEFDALPAVERWWAAMFAPRATEES